MDSERVFRLRLNCLDHYQSPPTLLDPPIFGPQAATSTQLSKLPDVPIIRVFGSTETGQKVCCHIRGAFPYLYIPYDESVAQDHVSQYMTTLRHSIDHALALSYRRNPYEDPRRATFVAHISLVKGIPFYGYNVGHKYFLKVYLLNPAHMTRFSDLLQQGAILRQVFQPYEAHLQYLLQWMCDFNLYGCAYIDAKKPKFRAPLPAWDDIDDPAHLWHDQSVRSENILDVDKFPRQSHCQLELDLCVEDILNRHAIQPRPLHHSFIERLASLENLPPEEKLVHSMAGLWKDETRRRRLRMGLTDPSSSPFPPEVLVSMSADPRNTDKGGWIHEEEFRDLVDNLAQEEKEARRGEDISFESFSSRANSNDKDGVRTVLDSVDDLFHDTLEKQWKQTNMHTELSQHFDLGNGRGTPSNATPEAVLVDESSIAQVLDEEETHGSDEEEAKRAALTQQLKLRKAGLGGSMGEAKVNGSAEQIKAQAEKVDDVLLPDNTTTPTRRGGLKRSAPTGAQTPFKKTRFTVQEISPKPENRKVRVQDVDHSGRDASASSLPGSDGFRLPGAAQMTKSGGSQDQTATVRAAEQHALSRRSSQGSQGIKSAFPTAKHVHDPETALRLSQRDDLAHLTHRGSRQKKKAPSTPAVSANPKRLSASRPRAKKSKVPSALRRRYASAFDLPAETDVLILKKLPPSSDKVLASLTPAKIYQDAYYSNEKDVPERPREYAGQEFRLASTSIPYLPAFNRDGLVLEDKLRTCHPSDIELDEQRRIGECSLDLWEITRPPPTFNEVQAWLKDNVSPEQDDLDRLEVDGPPATFQLKRKNKLPPELSQIEGPTQKNKDGAKYTQKKNSTSVQHETGYMSTMSLEVHVNSRGDLAPDPERDEVNMVAWCIADEKMVQKTVFGIAVLGREDDEDRIDQIRRNVGNNTQLDTEDNELDLINKMVDIVRQYDPDILTGFEVHNGSWGYLIERARLQYEYNLPDEFSRMKSKSHGRFGKDADRWGFTQTSTVSITGRHTINIWRAMRSELNLLQYTMENVVFNLLHRRIPHYSFATLTKWYQSKKPRDLTRLLDYLITRTKLDLEILEANELIPRTSEQARLLGVDFFSVFSRGSQFKVESLMFRIAKPESFVLVSPSRKQVGAQNALECLPLVMEPQSAFYSSPLLVLDFQSLYPSVMIAYNYCYSTCLGRVVNWRGTNKMGFTDFQRAPGLLELVKDKLNIAPNGMMYVKPEMRKSLLAKMLGEILETRVMVKSGMKVDKDDKTLQRLLNNRQLALKLIANVTYGYTSASFSGRMPCSEIADSIVQTGRETLEKAIAFIHSVERWGAEVVYGDTDSLFVYLKGRARDDAFRIGDEIAKAVTDLNPRPVKLKFEKVYHPCVLLAKKRYVGFKYESPKQTEPDFDAKGIETVRRDGTPAEQKIEEKALKLLFRTADLSQIKQYFQKQCTKILAGRVSVQDFCFAKEVKLGTYADKGPPPPGALIATKRMLRDPRMEPQYGERVPFVVIAGAPGARLWERCVEPERLIYDENAELDAEYYINKNLIPPLERIFNLMGANVRQWFDEMPKVQRIRMLGAHREGEVDGRARKTMESYMGSSLCVACRTKLEPVESDSEELELPLCPICRYETPTQTLLALRRKYGKVESRVTDLEQICKSCAGLAFDDEVRCDSRDCPVFYSRVKAVTQLGVARNGIGKVVEEFEKEILHGEDLQW